jgi:NAD(P)H-hydrate epimerase
MKILSADQIRKWDEYTILNEPISSIELMERAAQQCSTWLEEKKLFKKKLKFFCGKGNNGGDGLAIARQLLDKGVTSEVYILETGSTGSSDFQSNLTRLRSLPVPIHFIQHADFFPKIDQTDVVIDAIYGSGLNRPLDGLSAQLVEYLNNTAATVISIDLPSGLYADEPSTHNPVIKATHTLTFQVIKLSFLFPEHEQFFGDVHVLPIGLAPEYLQTISSGYHLADMELIRHIYKPRKQFAHKGTYGHALIIAGEKGKMGAAVMCTKACLRAGAGLVTAIVPEHQFAIIHGAVPEAMAMAQELSQSVEWPKFSTIGIGPGIGTDVDGTGMVEEVLTHFNSPIVIDADGLNILSTNDELLMELPPGSILTPHPKEFERLFGKTENHLERIQLARAQAQKLFVYIIVKGHYSLVACPDGDVYFNSTGNPGMATGGSGDVLTGILTGLLAQGYSSKETCILGMFLHGLAGDLAAKHLSQEAMLAGDLLDHLGKAFLTISSNEND